MIIQPIVPRTDCTFCADLKNPWDRLLELFPMELYCICLKDRDDRHEKACEEFHRVGLCKFVKFYRPERAKSFVIGCFQSHYDLAKFHGTETTKLLTIFEDDISFDHNYSPNDLASSVNSALRNLSSSTWTSLAWGGIAYMSLYYAPGVQRSATLTTHAYSLSNAGIKWVLKHPVEVVGEEDVDRYRSIRMTHAYQLFPIIAYQRNLGSDHHMKFDEAVFLHPTGMKAAQYYIPILWMFAVSFLVIVFGIVIFYASKKRYTRMKCIAISTLIALIILSILWILIFSNII